MSDIGDSIKYFYEKFILRDLLAFVTPGAIVVMSVLLLHCDIYVIKEFFNDLKFVLYIPIYGVLFVVGFAVQCLGFEIIPWLFKFHNCEDDKEYYSERLIKIRRLNKDDEDKVVKQQHERFVILKLMCANNALAIFIGGILFIIKKWGLTFSSFWTLFHVVVLIFFLVIPLYIGHRTHLNRQGIWEEEVLKK